MYNKIIVTETTEEAKKPQNKSKGKNLKPTAIFWHYSVIILALLFDGEEARRNRSPWICPGKVLPTKRKDQREVAERPKKAAPGKISRDWKRAVSNFAEGSVGAPRSRMGVGNSPPSLSDNRKQPRSCLR